MGRGSCLVFRGLMDPLKLNTKLWCRVYVFIRYTYKCSHKYTCWMYVCKYTYHIHTYKYIHIYAHIYLHTCISNLDLLGASIDTEPIEDLPLSLSIIRNCLVWLWRLRSPMTCRLLAGDPETWWRKFQSECRRRLMSQLEDSHPDKANFLLPYFWFSLDL